MDIHTYNMYLYNGHFSTSQEIRPLNNIQSKDNVW